MALMSRRFNAVGEAGVARGLRITAWAGLLALFGVRLALLGGLLGERPSALSEITYLAPLVLSAIGATLAVLRCRGVERKFWLCLLVATVLLVAHEGYFSFYILFVDPVGPVVPAPFQVFALGAVIAFFAMIVQMSRFATAPPVTRARFYASVSGGLVVAYVLAFDLVIAPLFQHTAGVPLGLMAVEAVYPVVGATMLAGTAGVVLGWKLTGWRPWERLVAISLAVYGVGVALMPFWVQNLHMQTQTPSGVLDEFGMALGPYLLFMAVVYRLTSGDPAEELTPRSHLDALPWWLVTFYPVALWAAVPVIGYVGLSHSADPEAVVWLAAAMVLAFVLVLRSSLSWAELDLYRKRVRIDPLTGLENEAALRSRLSSDLIVAARYRGDLALIVVDIDDFSRVNDLSGHDAGDAVLTAVANLIRGVCPEGCGAYRAGGDEFALVAPGLTASEAEHVAGGLIRDVERDARMGELAVTISAGVAAFPSSVDAAELVSQAFHALQHSKLTSRGSVTVYDRSPDPLPSPQERLELARKQSYLATVRALAAAVDARDPVSREHSRNVSRLARRLAEALDLEPARAMAIETAGLIHDIGKIALPDELLLEHRPMSADEQARLREHVEVGERILRSTDLAFMMPWVRGHHERWDGLGYPDGLKSEEAPIEARILAVCDAYDAMTSGLHGIVALGHVEAMTDIERESGARFDPTVVRAFLGLEPWPS